MKQEGERELISIGGSYALVLPIQWARENRIRQEYKKVYVRIDEKSITIVPLSHRYQIPIEASIVAKSMEAPENLPNLTKV